MQYSKKFALEKEKALKNVLMKEKKLILILDLDNTMLHSTSFSGYQISPSYCGRLFKDKDLFQIPINGGRSGT